MTDRTPFLRRQLAVTITISFVAVGYAGAQSNDPLWDGYRDGAVRCHEFMKSGDFTIFSDIRERLTDLDEFRTEGFREVTWVPPDALVRVMAFQNDLDDPRRRGCGVVFNYRNPYAEPASVSAKFDDWLAEDERWSRLIQTDFDIDVPDPGQLLSAYSDCAASPAPLLVFVTDFEGGPPHWIHFLEISPTACRASSMEAQ